MFRALIFLAFTLVFFNCRAKKPNYVPVYSFSALSQDKNAISGVITISSLTNLDHCEILAKNRVIEKFLYEGFENTSYWRPRKLEIKTISDKIRERLEYNVYTTRSNDESDLPKYTCKCLFQFNLNSSLQILENEGIIRPFGY